MKKVFLLYFVLCCSAAYTQVSSNLSLLSHFHDPALPKIGAQVWNECNGYVDTVKHKEYAIAGSVDSIYFFDITNPSLMKKCDVRTGLSHAINRDFAIYDHYVYCVTDNLVTGSAAAAFQVFDLQYLPDSVHEVYRGDATGYRTHTIFVNPKSQRLYKCINYVRDSSLTTTIIPIQVYSLRDPVHPTLMTSLTRASAADVHESYVRNDTVYCSSGNQGLFIYDMTDTASIRLLGKIIPPYPENAYNHSSWLDSTGRYILFTDETAEGTGMKLYDLQDLSNPRLVRNPFRDYGSPHNAYWLGRFAYASMYYGGVNIYDLHDVNDPKLVAYYHTFDQPHTQGTYEGCWGVYPFLPSGNLLASDMNTGIYLLKASATLGVASPVDPFIQVGIFPNPFTKAFTLSVSSAEKQAMHLLVYDLRGKIAVETTFELNSGTQQVTIDQMQDLPAGLYVIKLVSPNGVHHQSIIKQ